LILNSGSDSHGVINGFKAVLQKYPEARIIYTAIRPKSSNPRYHKWMIEALNIQDGDEVKVIQLPKPKP
jgi:hypothetical protein